MFDMSFGQLCGGWLLILGLAIIGIKKMARSFDRDGAVKDEAKKGVVRMIGRWLR